MHKLLSRRNFLQQSGGGLGMLALTAMLAEQGLVQAAAPALADPFAPRKPPEEAKAKNVIFLFMSGGPSHLETFDPKPELQRMHGQKLPASFGMIRTRRGVDRNKLLATKRTFKKYGQSGLDVSD